MLEDSFTGPPLGDAAPLRNRWRELLARLGASPRADALFDELHAHYSETTRHYHTFDHIRDCLTQFDSVRAHARDADALEFAIWTHDIIYDPLRGDNERLSAEWARRALMDHGVATARASAVYTLIIATMHAAVPSDPDAQLLCDIDLAILGAAADRFDAYEVAIRKEYDWVPEPIFRARRAEILEQFLSRPALFATKAFHSRFEDTARSNLSRSLAVLRGG